MENLEDLPDNIGIGSLDDLDYLIMLAGFMTFKAS